MLSRLNCKGSVTGTSSAIVKFISNVPTSDSQGAMVILSGKITNMSVYFRPSRGDVFEEQL